MKEYVRPELNVLYLQVEAPLATSIPIGDDPVDPGQALDPGPKDQKKPRNVWGDED